MLGLKASLVALMSLLALVRADTAPLPGQPAPEAVELQVAGTRLSLFPFPGRPCEIIVRARKTVPDAATLRCRIIIDNFGPRPETGYMASDPVRLDLAQAGRWYEGRLLVSAGADPVTMCTGKLLIVGSAGKRSIRRDIPLRMGRGALAFLERRLVRFPEGARKVDVACLENALLRAEFVPERGCLSGLYSPRSPGDMLIPGDYPLGFIWAGFKEWYHKSMSGPGQTVAAEFTARAAGGKALMRATLREDDVALSINIDASDLKASPGPLYIMATASPSSTDKVNLALEGDARELTPGPSAVQVPAEVSTGAVRLLCTQQQATLSVDFSAPALESVSVGAQPPWYNFAALNFAEGTPGVMDFRLGLITAPGLDGAAP